MSGGIIGGGSDARTDSAHPRPKMIFDLKRIEKAKKEFEDKKTQNEWKWFFKGAKTWPLSQKQALKKFKALKKGMPKVEDYPP